MKYQSAFFGFFDQSLRIVGALVAVGGLGLLTLYFWSPEVAPLPPGELSRPDVSRLIDDLPGVGQGDEFVSRPLFVQGRRPLVVVNASSEKVVKDEPAPPAKALKNVKLLGVFSSGDSNGVILQEDGGDRRRLLVGDKTGEWTLTAVEPRGALFEAGGVQSRLAMGLLAKGLPKARLTAKAQVTGEDKLAKEEEAARPKNWQPSFDDIYQRRRPSRSAADDAEADRDAADTAKRDEL